MGVHNRSHQTGADEAPPGILATGLHGLTSASEEIPLLLLSHPLPRCWHTASVAVKDLVQVCAGLASVGRLATQKGSIIYTAVTAASDTSVLLSVLAASNHLSVCHIRHVKTELYRGTFRRSQKSTTSKGFQNAAIQTDNLESTCHGDDTYHMDTIYNTEISQRQQRDITEIAQRYHRDITEISQRYHRIA